MLRDIPLMGTIFARIPELLVNLRTVSVVIPTYNRPALLRQTIASVFAQTLTEFQVIVVDDGSTDETPAVLEELRGTYGDRLQVVRQENGGIGAARNAGIAHATGTYIALLDHDDLWMPEKLARQVEFMEERPGCVGCMAALATTEVPDSLIVNPLSLPLKNGLIERPARAAADNPMIFVTCSGFMFRREAAHGVAFSTARNTTEDIAFYIGLMGRGHIGFVGETPLGLYRVHVSSASGDPMYHDRGVSLNRRLIQSGQLGELSAHDRRDCLSWIAATARSTTMLLLLSGRRRQAWRRYFQEVIPQLAERRWKYLLTFPILGFAPLSRVRRLISRNDP